VNYDTKVAETRGNYVTVTTMPVVMSVTSRRAVALLSAFALAILLTACGAKGVIQTTDESAEYKSARSLPPLKKPSEVVEETSVAQSVSSSTVSSDAVLTDEGEQRAILQAEVDAQGLITDKPIEVSEPSPELEPLPETLSASAVDVGDSKSQLEITGNFDRAWQYLAATLQKSEVTVFSRNNAAGRFAIGCSGVAEDRVVVEKKGGWSFFKRGKDQEAEYCSLKLSEKRGLTYVSVHDRNGIEVANQNSANLFARILNN